MIKKLVFVLLFCISLGVVCSGCADDGKINEAVPLSTKSPIGLFDVRIEGDAGDRTLFVNGVRYCVKDAIWDVSYEIGDKIGEPIFDTPAPGVNKSTGEVYEVAFDTEHNFFVVWYGVHVLYTRADLELPNIISSDIKTCMFYYDDTEFMTEGDNLLIERFLIAYDEKTALESIEWIENIYVEFTFIGYDGISSSLRLYGTETGDYYFSKGIDLESETNFWGPVWTAEDGNIHEFILNLVEA